jgi:hypothetical protein
MGIVHHLVTQSTKPFRRTRGRREADLVHVCVRLDARRVKFAEVIMSNKTKSVELCSAGVQKLCSCAITEGPTQPRKPTHAPQVTQWVEKISRVQSVPTETRKYRHHHLHQAQGPSRHRPLHPPTIFHSNPLHFLCSALPDVQHYILMQWLDLHER